MKYLSLQPFVPSGSNFELAKNLFLELGFNLSWESGGYAGFENNGCQFILQQFDNKEFAENFMLSIGIENAEAFRADLIEKQLSQKFGIRISEVMNQPYGKEVNIIDIAGVCWHFVQQ